MVEEALGLGPQVPVLGQRSDVSLGREAAFVDDGRQVVERVAEEDEEEAEEDLDEQLQVVALIGHAHAEEFQALQQNEDEDYTVYEDASVSMNTKLCDATNRPENHTPEEKVPVVRELGRHTPGYKYLSGSVS